MKVIVIDSNYLLREGLKKVLSLEKDIELIGESSNIREAVENIKNKEPELVITDLKLGNEDGLKIVEEIRNLNIECKFIILTNFVEYSSLRKVEDLGIEGYVLKDAPTEEILHAIKVVGLGRKYFDTNIIIHIIKKEKELLHKDQAIENLTKREKEVLIALGKGLTNSEIATMLQITEFTVKKHVSQVLLKLDFADRTQAAIYANYHGLIS